jgi:hypothetical protein
VHGLGSIQGRKLIEALKELEDEHHGPFFGIELWVMEEMQATGLSFIKIIVALLEGKLPPVVHRPGPNPELAAVAGRELLDLAPGIPAPFGAAID